jgi:hypothetical protein
MEKGREKMWTSPNGKCAFTLRRPPTLSQMNPHHSRSVLGLSCASLLLVLACSDKKACTAGETQPCHCPDGSIGAQTCRENGTGWNQCECDATDADTDTDALDDTREEDPLSDHTDTPGDLLIDTIHDTPADSEDATEEWSLDGSDLDFDPVGPVFVLPYEDDPYPASNSTVHGTDIVKADFFFLVDATYGMEGEIDSLSAGSMSIDYDVTALVADRMYAAGQFLDYPDGGYGSSGQEVFELIRRTSASHTMIDAIGLISTSYPTDVPASQVPALWSTATGLGLGSYLADADECTTTEIGYPCFRPGSLPVILLYSQTEFHNGPLGEHPYSGITPVPPTYPQAIDALDAIHAKVLCIECSVRTEVEEDCAQVALDTGATDALGDPIVGHPHGSGGDIPSVTTSVITTLLTETPMDVSVEAIDITVDSVDITVFIDRLEPNTTGGITDPEDSTLTCVGGLPVADADGDTVDDRFSGITPGTITCFDVYPARNTTVPPTSEPQVFPGSIVVTGHDVTELSSKPVYFVVPPG